MAQTALTCVLIGSDSLLIECGEIWLAREHHIDAVVTDSSRVADWGRRRGLHVIDIGADGDVTAALAHRSFDYLFAITFLRMLPKAALALPKRAAINFHDGPLPRYAGLNAPAWALINQEREYGITWHVMSEQLDKGDLLKQQRFEVSDDETSLSLNTRCFGVAIESFGALTDELAAGTAQGTPQATVSVSKDDADADADADKAYFGKYARPAAAGVLDFREPAEKLAALVRALDFGPRYPNTLAAPTIIAGGRAFSVTNAEASLEETSAAPGTIVAAGADSFSVACGQGTLIVQGLRAANGAVVPMHEAVSELKTEVGGSLTLLDDAERSALTELDGRLAKKERAWVDLLATADPIEPPYVSGVGIPTGVPGRLAQLPLAVPAPFRARFGSDTAIVAAFATYLGRLAGTREVSLALADGSSKGASPGFAPLLSSAVPCQMEVEPAPSFGEVVTRVDAALAQARERGSFLRSVAVRYPELADSPLLHDPGLMPVGVALAAPASAGSVLQLQVVDGAAQLCFAPERLDDTAAARISSELCAFMENLAQAADKPVEQTPLLTPQVQQQLLVGWNNTHRDSPQIGCVHQQIEAQVDRTPDAVAVVCEGQSLTFRQLDEASNAVAHRLIALGVSADKPVGVYAERSIDLVVAALGVMKSGGAYVPLDPAYPQERIALMLEDAHLDVVVTQSALASKLASRAVRSVLVDALDPHDQNQAGPPPTLRPHVAVAPEHIAYLIYTSGSTGKPKGVMVEHRQVVNFFEGMDERVPHADSARVFLAVTSLSFDISVLELWWTLSRGFKVVVHADRARASAGKPADPSVARPVEFSLFYFSADANAEGGARYRLLLEGARFADDHGFSAVWTPERHFHAFGGLYPNPAVTGAAVAAITKRVGIRAGSVVLPLHHPARVAEQWAVVDNISNGRVGVSVASGWQPNDFVFAKDNYKGAKSVMMQNLELVRRLWRGETIEFEGPHGPVPVRTLPDPVQKELPVWITTAGNAETFEMAGKAGANVLTHLLGQSLEKLAPKIAAYRKARAAAGFDPDTGVVSLMLHTFVGADREQVKETVRGPLKAYLATSMDLIKDKAWVFPTFQRPKGKEQDESAGDLTSLTDEERDALLDAAFERYFEHSGLFGTVEDAMAMVHKVKAIGVDDLACLVDFGAPVQLVLDHLPYLDGLRKREAEERQSMVMAMPMTALPAASMPADSDPEQAAATTTAATTDEHPFLRDVREHAVTHMQCTPSMARMLLDHEDSSAALGQLKHLLLGGEALTPDLLQDLRKRTQASITNMYGPTETTVWSSTHPVSATETSVPIGTPIANTSLYVTDAQQRLLPPDVIGELWIGGQGVTRGYWERPELTAERFVSDPFSNVAGARMYRTGDRARWRSDGVMEFFGRADHQVKLRGYRIELGEIEARARAAASVKDAVVIVREDRPGDQRLVAYLVPQDGVTLDHEAVRAALRAQLPEFMVPASFVQLAELPLTPNRKIDRKALPAPHPGQPGHPGGTDGHAQHAEAGEAVPQSELDQSIASVWREVLGRDAVGLDDNFFDLGGHSLLVVRAHRQLQKELGRALALTDLYRFPTIRRFSAFLSQAQDADTDTKKAGARGAKRRQAMRRRTG